mmetsp:Transcript_11388/g.23421  ORF Transcript_11388/g.23421 Transcript_11388/m.23421 type:complete len:257 (-) Transcript_11388:314-1084(-)
MRIFLQHAICPFSFNDESKVVLHDSTSVWKLIGINFAGVSSRIAIQICPFHTSHVGLAAVVHLVVLSSIPWKNHARFGCLCALTLPRSKSTTDSRVLRSSFLVLASIRPGTFVKYSVFVFHTSFSVRTTLLVDLTRVISKITKLISEGHLFDIPNKFTVGKLGGHAAIQFALFLSPSLRDLSLDNTCQVFLPVILFQFFSHGFQIFVFEKVASNHGIVVWVLIVGVTVRELVTRNIAGVVRRIHRCRRKKLRFIPF